MKINTDISDETVVPENPKKVGLGKSQCDFEISNKASKKQAKFLHCSNLKM
jgi:hypothetical protein